MSAIKLTPARCDIEFTVGTDLDDLFLVFVDDAGAAVDVSGYTIEAKVLRGGEVLATDFTPSVGGVGSNILQLSMTDTETTTVGVERGLTWALRMTLAGVTKEWVAGQFTGFTQGQARRGNSTAAVFTVGEVTVTLSTAAPIDTVRAAIAADIANPASAISVELASQYAPSSYIYFTGASSNFVQSPDAAKWTPATTLDVRAGVAFADWTPSGINMAIGHYEASGSQRSWALGVNTTGRLAMLLSADGVSASVINSSVSPTVNDGEFLAIRGVWAAATPDVTFYTKPWVSADDLALDTGWTQLGTVVTSSVPATLLNSTSTVNVGSAGAASYTTGGIGAVWVEVDGAVAGSPDFTVPWSPRFRDAEGNIWTQNGSAYAWSTA